MALLVHHLFETLQSQFRFCPKSVIASFLTGYRNSQRKPKYTVHQTRFLFDSTKRQGSGEKARDCYSRRLLQLSSITIRLVPVDCNWLKLIGDQGLCLARALSVVGEACGRPMFRGRHSQLADSCWDLRQGARSVLNNSLLSRVRS